VVFTDEGDGETSLAQEACNLSIECC